jgi:outer membrane protein OmpA-like peptidoglycan-associated protein
MKFQLVFGVIAMLFLTNTVIFAQRGDAKKTTEVAFSEAPADVAFWVDYWAKPRVVIFGPEQEAFNQNVHEILFPWNDHDGPSNPNVLDENVQWLKDHASDRFYIEGYASSRGDLGYNVTLSMRRADWVKQTLISKGIAENRIVSTAGWGQLYPVCPELNDECWSKNRVVRFVYSPNRDKQ